MNEKMDAMLNTLIRPGVEYNLQQMAFAGVAFYRNENGRVSGLVAAPYFIIELEDIDMDPQGEFYHYISNSWQTCPYPIPIPDVVARLVSPQYIGKVTVPFTNFVNHMNKMEDRFKRKTRVVMAPHELKAKDRVLVFKEVNGRKIFSHPSLQQPCIISDSSLIPAEYIVPGQAYKCIITERTSDAWFVSAIRPYAKVQMGLHYSEHGFFPENMDIVNSLVNIPPDFILGANTIDPVQNFAMPAIHLDCTLLYDLVRVFGLTESSLIDVFVGNDPNVPITMRNVKTRPEEPQINILMGTLNPYYGAQRR